MFDIDVENIPNVVNELQYIVKQPKNDNDEFIDDGWLREYIGTIDSQCYESKSLKISGCRSIGNINRYGSSPKNIWFNRYIF